MGEKEEEIFGYPQGLERREEFGCTEGELQNVDELAVLNMEEYEISELFEHNDVLDFGAYKCERTSENFPKIIMYEGGAKHANHGELIFDMGDVKDQIRQKIKERSVPWTKKVREPDANNPLWSDINSVESNIKRIASVELGTGIVHNRACFWKVRPEISEAYARTITKTEEGGKELDRSIILLLKEMVKISHKYEKLPYNEENRYGSIGSYIPCLRLTESTQRENIEGIKKYGKSCRDLALTNPERWNVLYDDKGVKTRN